MNVLTMLAEHNIKNINHLFTLPEIDMDTGFHGNHAVLIKCLTCINNAHYRNALCRFRCSAHNLLIHCIRK